MLKPEGLLIDCLAASVVINKFKVPNFDGLWGRIGLGGTYYVHRINIFQVLAKDKLMSAA